MPTPSGLKISELPSGISPASGSDLLVLVQNGNTVQVPVSGVRRNTTAELPESGNLYYTDARARAAFAAGEGLIYSSTNGEFQLDPVYIDTLSVADNDTVTGISIYNLSADGRRKNISLLQKDGGILSAQWVDQGQDISITAQQGLSVNIVNGIWNISNSDRGSSQNIFKTITVSGSQSLIANSNTDYITIIPGSNIGITSNSGNRTITINAVGTSNPVTGIVAGTGISVSRVSGEVTVNNSDRGSVQNIFKTIAVSGLTSIAATGNADTLTFVAGSNINFSTDPSTNKLVINAVSGAGLVGNVTSVNGLSGTVVLTTDNIGEGNAQYFTADRARSVFTAGNGINITNGIITNTDRFSSGNVFKTISVSGQSSIVASGSNSTLNLVQGNGVTLTTNNSNSSITIAASGGNASAGGPTGSIQFNRLNSLSGVSAFTYNYNDDSITKLYGNVKIYNAGSLTGIRIIGSGNPPEKLQTWENINGAINSYISNSGCFVGAVAPTVSSVFDNLILSDIHNGMTLHGHRETSSSAVYFTISSGITIPNWNVKITQFGTSQNGIQTSGAINLLYPSDKIPLTRKRYSVVNIYRKENSPDFILYGDLAASGGDPVSPGTPVTPPPEVPPTPTPGPCAGASSAPPTISFLRGDLGIISSNTILTTTATYPSVGIYPTPQYPAYEINYAWSPAISIGKSTAFYTVTLPKDPTCYEYYSWGYDGYSTGYLTPAQTFIVTVGVESDFSNSVSPDGWYYAEKTFWIVLKPVGSNAFTTTFTVPVAQYRT